MKGQYVSAPALVVFHSFLAAYVAWHLVGQFLHFDVAWIEYSVKISAAFITPRLYCSLTYHS